MANMTIVRCASCNTEFQARTADVNRGWGKFCSKSCKAKKQTKDTGIAGPHYKADGRTVRQMKQGHYAKSKFTGRRLPREITHDRYGDPHLCHCGEPATQFVNNSFGDNGWEGQCDNCADDTHPHEDSNFDN